jgi:hypothetical protein
MTTDEPIRTVLLGYGLPGRLFHAPFLRAVPDFELLGVVTANPDRAAQVKADLDVPVIASAEEVWKKADQYDLAVITTSNVAHVRLAHAALDAGLNVVVDKPLCAEAATARELANHAESVGRLLVTFQNRRWDDDFLAMSRLVSEGRVGDVVRLESRFERWRPTLKGGWRESGDPADLGGLLYDLGPHVIDQALLLLGPAERVYAEVRVVRPGALTSDDVFVAVTHQSGAISHHWCSMFAAEPAPRLRLLGTRGTFTSWGMDPQEDALRIDARVPMLGSPEPWGVRETPDDVSLATDDARQFIELEPGDYREFWAQLANAINGHGPSPVPIEQTIALTAVLDAAHESAATGQTVSV